MATDFFTLIGLVLAVSGSTYAAIAGIHAWLAEGVKAKHKRSEYCCQFIDENGTDETKTNGARDQNSVWWCRFCWHSASLVPILLFLLFSFTAAIHVYVHFLTTPAPAEPPTPVAGRLPVVGPAYMHSLAVITFLDAACIVITFWSYGCLRSALNRLESGFRQCDEIINNSKSGTAKIEKSPE